MISIQCLVNSIQDVENELHQLDKSRDCLVQIFTSTLVPEEAVALAQQVQGLLPHAHIIGSSVNALIYKGEQYECATMVVIEQYAHSTISTHLMPFEHHTPTQLAGAMAMLWETPPQLVRLFTGAYYDGAHQMVEELNHLLPSVKLAGGFSGEIQCVETVPTPFVFTPTTAMAEGMVFAALHGAHLNIYSRINTAHETVGPAYTITQTEDRAITTIEGQPAQLWLQRNLGFLSTKEYTTWEDIADNDPLVRFQLALEEHGRAIRFVRFEEATHEISQYFTHLDAGTKFRISYTSPSKCVAECHETCLELQETPVEQLFCYNCLFRKLYLKNCASWELAPFHENPVNGVFLLGEFGYDQGANALLNGSCVLCGIAEEDRYLSIDMDRLAALESVQEENDGLLDFIMRKQAQPESEEQQRLLSDIVFQERTHHSELYRYIDINTNMSNMLKYELDDQALHFDKICLVKIENTDMLMSYIGQTKYFAQINAVIAQANKLRVDRYGEDLVKIYAGNTDTFVISATNNVNRKDFLDSIQILSDYCDSASSAFVGTPILMRFVVVFGDELLLERAYSLLQANKTSQSRIIVDDAVQQKMSSPRDELECISLIQYALAQNQVIPYYQGLYNNETKTIDKYEALMRIRDREGKILSPIHFMEIAKKYRLYLELNLKMFEKVLDDFGTIDCSVNINLSAHDIASPRFRHVMRERLSHFHKPGNLTFEILEDEYLTDMQGLKDFIAEVRSYGAKIAIDDFGSGYSNLLEIIKIRPDHLKIDGQIIRELHRSSESEAIVNVVSALGKQLSIDLVAEFVENEEIQALVEKYEILRSQGYHFSKPQPFETVYESVTADVEKPE